MSIVDDNASYVSASRHSSAPVEAFMERWARPNTRNRSYTLRQEADPIAAHEHLPERPNSGVGNRAGFRYPRATDRRRLPPSKYGDGEKHVPQILQQDWNGPTAFANDRKVDFRFPWRFGAGTIFC